MGLHCKTHQKAAWSFTNQGSSFRLGFLLSSGKARMVQRTFFGHMIQGSVVNRDGSTTIPITIPIGTIRMWDTGAVWYYVGDREPHNWDGFEGFIALGQRL